MKSGTMLAHYRVDEKIGVGGMGEVYRAFDTTLGREVALKVLPPEFAQDSDRMARFQREAKMLASLNHPNIAAIHGFESLPDCTFLVMELVQGEDLSEIIQRGALPVDEAVDIARQIAEGLEEAHEKGIVHRDLKPANVKRTPDGKVKVLDFGLARAFAGQEAGEGQVSSAMTMTAAMTQAGVILGTAAYMSPEQARGKEVDRRTDIWAFGVILFEMLTGKQIFAGETATDTLAGILKIDPDWDSLPSGLPNQVERVLRRCLSKDPRQRLRDIGEARVRLENPEAESGQFTGSMAPVDYPAGRRGLTLLPWALVVVCLGAVGWLLLFGTGPKKSSLVSQLGFPPPEDTLFMINGNYPGLPVVSPDGRSVVFSARSKDDGAVKLYLRTLAADRAVALDGTDGCQYPFWSPDSQWIAFFDRNTGLKKIRAAGGPTQVICDAGNGKGGSWNEAGEIIFTPEYNASIKVVSALGGQPREVTTLVGDDGVDSHRHPEFLPDGRHFLYLARGAGGTDSEVRMASLDGGPTLVVMPTLNGVSYADGYLFHTTGQTLVAQPFDPDSGLLTGDPQPVADGVLVITGAAKSAFSVSQEGTLVYLRGGTMSDASLVWLDANGIEGDTVGDNGDYSSVVLSPDGALAAATVMDRQAGTLDIWIVDIGRNFRTRFTTSPADDSFPVWEPDGRALLFISDRDGKGSVFRKEIGGSGEPRKVFSLDRAIMLWDCFDQGQSILYSVSGDSTSLDLWSAEISGDSEPRLLKRSPVDDAAGKISFDGKWISFWSMDTGLGQVYLAPWPAMSPITQVSTDTGAWSFWTDQPGTLFFQDGEGRMYWVAMDDSGPRLQLGLPELLFEHLGPELDGPKLDITRDGQRFFAIKSVEAEPPVVCDLVLNWPGLIKRD